MTNTSKDAGLLPAEHRGRIFGLAAMVFLILGSYAIARPATESLFVEQHGAAAIPWAWLLVALGSVILVSAYSHWAARVDLVRAFGLVSALSAWVLVACLAAIEMDLPGSRYVLFLWKDIYIVMLVEIFWSFSNQVFPIKKATRLYGFFLVIGGLGGMMGNLLGGEVATLIGTRSVLVVVVPMLLIARLGCLWMGRGVRLVPAISTSSGARSGLLQGLQVLSKSRVLLLLMALIALTQVVINLIDYQTQIALEQYYPDTDERTQIIGRIYAAVDLVALGLQLTTGPILRLLGVPLVMFLIPGLLAGFVIGAAAWPRMITIAITKVASKAFDYSIFRAAKELFYIPLSHSEKTQGKAFVDMMTYRVSKGLVSILLLSLGTVAAGWVWGITGLALLAWIVIVVQLVRRVPEISERMPSGLGARFGPLALSAGVVTGLTCVLVWPMPLELNSRTVVGPFHDGHVWCFWQMKQMLMGEASTLTSAIGWPTSVQAQLIGWGPGVMVAPLQGILGPIGAYNTSLLMTGALNAVVCGGLCLVLGARPWSAAAGGLIVAMCPYALDALANGQVVKMQIWILVLQILTVWASTRAWWSLPLVVLASLLLAFTSPSLAMALPFALAVLLPAFILSSPRRVRAAVSGALALGLTAASLIWASDLYNLDPSMARQSAFFPASVQVGDYNALLEQIARIDSVFLGGVPKGFHADHVPYLGLVAVIIGVLCSLKSFRGRWVGWGLLIVGVGLALGPRLADASGFVSIGGGHVPMPAVLLEKLDYPIIHSGMYHRFLVLASLGLAILVACGTRVFEKRGGYIAWFCAAVLISDALYQSRDRWPRETERVQGLSAYAEMAADPVAGAVVVFPLRVNDTGGGTQIMLSTLHERATTGLPRYDYWERSEAPQQLLAMFESAEVAESGAQACLATEGIRYVLWAPWVQYGDGGPNLQDLSDLLGPPQVDGELRWWRIEAG